MMATLSSSPIPGSPKGTFQDDVVECNGSPGEQQDVKELDLGSPFEVASKRNGKSRPWRLPWREGGVKPQQIFRKSYKVTNSKIRSIVGGNEMDKMRHSLPRSGSAVEGSEEVHARTDEEQEREHAILFDDGSSYSGEWKNGRIHGRGVFLWANGDRFEGEWKDDLQNGQGTYAAADGSVYYGGWKNGVKDGDGVYRPAPGGGDGSAPMVYLRTYRNGELVKNIGLRMKEKKDKQQLKEIKKQYHMDSRPLKPGEVIYKGHHSYDLMRQLQVGIMYGIAQESPVNTLGRKDYSSALVQNFPNIGDVPGFKYKEYLPKVFQRLRESCGIDNADYLVSLTGGPALREMPSPGASGCIFFLSEDDRFLIKSVRKEEMGIFLHFMKQYEKYVCSNPMTLLVKFYGIHRVRPWLGQNARFVVMGNVLPTGKRMHRKYDLKGSTYKRTVGAEKMKDPDATLKDLDIDMKFEISTERYQAIMHMIVKDVHFLSKRRLIDYSLLLGVHFIAWGETAWYPPGQVWGPSSRAKLIALEQRQFHGSLAFSRNMLQNMEEYLEDEQANDYAKDAANLIASANSVRDAARSSAASGISSLEVSKRKVKGMPSRNLTRKFTETSGSNSSLNVNDLRFSDPIGWGTPAVAIQVDSDGNEHRQPVLLYFGIIDFLQKYNSRKRIEKIWKQTLHGDGVSVSDPKHYADRFVDFMKSIFIEKGDHWQHSDYL